MAEPTFLQIQGRGPDPTMRMIELPIGPGPDRPRGSLRGPAGRPRARRRPVPPPDAGGSTWHYQPVGPVGSGLDRRPARRPPATLPLGVPFRVGGPLADPPAGRQRDQRLGDLRGAHRRRTRARGRSSAASVPDVAPDPGAPRRTRSDPGPGPPSVEGGGAAPTLAGPARAARAVAEGPPGRAALGGPLEVGRRVDPGPIRAGRQPAPAEGRPSPPGPRRPRPSPRRLRPPGSPSTRPSQTPPGGSDHRARPRADPEGRRPDPSRPPGRVGRRSLRPAPEAPSLRPGRPRSPPGSAIQPARGGRAMVAPPSPRPRDRLRDPQVEPSIARPDRAGRPGQARAGRWSRSREHRPSRRTVVDRTCEVPPNRGRPDPRSRRNRPGSSEFESRLRSTSPGHGRLDRRGRPRIRSSGRGIPRSSKPAPRSRSLGPRSRRMPVPFATELRSPSIGGPRRRSRRTRMPGPRRQGRDVELPSPPLVGDEGPRRLEWPSARAIFEAQGRRTAPGPRTPGGRRRRGQAAVRARADLGVAGPGPGPADLAGLAPGPWSVSSWSAGRSGLGLASNVAVEANAANLAIRLASRGPRRLARFGDRPGDDPPGRLVDLDRAPPRRLGGRPPPAGDGEDHSEDIRSLLDGRATRLPARGPIAVRGRAPRPTDPGGGLRLLHLGRTRDVVTLVSSTGRKLRKPRASSTPSAIRAYRSAMEIASKASRRPRSARSSSRTSRSAATPCPARG